MASIGAIISKIQDQFDELYLNKNEARAGSEQNEFMLKNAALEEENKILQAKIKELETTK